MPIQFALHRVMQPFCFVTRYHGILFVRRESFPHNDPKADVDGLKMDPYPRIPRSSGTDDSFLCRAFMLRYAVLWMVVGCLNLHSEDPP